MSVTNNFKNFCQDIKISSSVQIDVSRRYKRITKQLNKDFWDSESETNHSLYVGSYGRDTAIHVSDIDMLMQLPYSYYETYNNYQGNGQSALLQAVRESIQGTYNSYIKGDGQVVVVSFTDGITFEILPCFINKNDSYTYPDTHNGGSWKVTDPKPEIAAIRNGDLVWNYNLKRLCRMARAWKDKWNMPIGGILIDTLAYQFMANWPHNQNSYTYYDWMMRDFFYFLHNQPTTQTYWIAPGSNHHVNKEGEFSYRSLRCYNLAKEAIEYEQKDMPYSARAKWQEIFGTKYKG